MANQTAGLFGGLLIASALLAGGYYVTNGFSFTPKAASTSTTTSPPYVPTPVPNTGVGQGGWGSISTPYAPALTTSPYQLAYSPTSGVQINTAAELTEADQGLIPLPTTTPLAPTVPSLYLA